MDKLKLITPSKEYSKQILSYRKEFLDNNDSMDGTSTLKKFEVIDEWFEWVKNNGHAETCAPGWVPDTQFLCIRQSDDRLVGMVDVRHILNDYLLNFGGHIGYSIRKSERNKGYAKEQLRLALLEGKKLGLERVLVTCYKDNIASQKVILALGGVLEDEAYDESDASITQRYWIDNH